MPLVRLPNRKLLYFTHVPKCAGTAVERYLQTRFGAIGLLDESFGRRSNADAWMLSPPQHMPESVRRELLPDTLFDGKFATVRHPATRLRSVFMFQKLVEKSLPERIRFDRWVETLPRTLALDPYALYGHLRPMAEQVPETARVFHVEHGLTNLVTWLDEQAENEDGPRNIVDANVTVKRISATEYELPLLTQAVCDRIAELYWIDYDRFGYDPQPNEENRTP
ncbi:MAG: sulfotransferase family protein [Rhodobacteraceae bacterium]|nr:sulfotransferase family protein [Paracoccaceae bacterium]